MTEQMDRINAQLEKMALHVVMLESDDIPGLGVALTLLSELKKTALEIDHLPFTRLITAIYQYIEKMVMSEVLDIEPLEEGISLLQRIGRSLDDDSPPGIDIDSVIGRLNAAATELTALPADEASIVMVPERPSPDSIPAPAPPPPATAMSSEEAEIIKEFVLESVENLETIELSLVDLEQDPTDKDALNTIFRPFHTIKGVSGFLNMLKINRLAHSTENLLDSARQGEYIISDSVVDVILESVDMLKKIINGVEQNMAAGRSDLEGDIDIDPLIRTIEDVGRRAVSGIPERLGEILVKKGAMGPADLQRGLEKLRMSPGKQLGEVLLDEKIVESKEIISALRGQKKEKRLADLQVKVDTVKLDNLVDQTGELVIAQAMLRQNNKLLSLNDHQVYQNMNRLTQIISALQKIAMSMRMVPIKSTFQKMVRLVRDLARNSGKKVFLEMSGEDTEIDRNVVDALYEPMVHMIRNSADHGLETPAERTAAGKSEAGVIWLRAFHKGGNIIIEIEDDGRGLNKERILEKAIATKLIDAGAKLTDSEIFDLIMHPGFSTAQKITDVSGRGVGMDVVKQGIEKLRGRLDIQSKSGKGTTFVITLPLTLAIIEGMMVRVGEERYIIPTMAIIESLRPKKADCYTVQGKGEMIQVRGKLIPLMRLEKLFGVKGDCRNPWEGLVMVVENKTDQRGLLLDELLGKEEVVIKNLGETLRHVKGLSGGAIIGDGQVGLILDMAGIFEIAAEQGRMQEVAV